MPREAAQASTTGDVNARSGAPGRKHDIIEAVTEEGVDAEDDVFEAVVDETPHWGCQARDMSGTKTRVGVACTGHAETRTNTTVCHVRGTSRRGLRDGCGANGMGEKVPKFPTLAAVEEVVGEDDDDVGDECMLDKDKGWSAEPEVAGEGHVGCL